MEPLLPIMIMSSLPAGAIHLIVSTVLRIVRHRREFWLTAMFSSSISMVTILAVFVLPEHLAAEPISGGALLFAITGCALYWACAIGVRAFALDRARSRPRDG